MAWLSVLGGTSASSAFLLLFVVGEARIELE
jgi:hypothetical protein